jgi:hypothetical protein
LSLSRLLALPPAGRAAPEDEEPAAKAFADRVVIGPGGKRDADEVPPVGKNGLALMGSEAKGWEGTLQGATTDLPRAWAVDPDIVRQGDRWIVVAEAMAPACEARTRAVPGADAIGKVQTRVETDEVFVGFRSTRAGGGRLDARVATADGVPAGRRTHEGEGG